MKFPSTLAAWATLATVVTATTVKAQQGNREGHVMTPPPAEWKIPPAPVVPAGKGAATFTLEDGFHAELVASEPNVHDPVVIAFDGNGRIWAVELRGYMPDVDGNNEDEPNGRIVILEDKDGDGTMESSTVFLEGIVLPRAIALVEGGILYGDQEKLYFVENLNDKPGKTTVIDDEWAKAGNVEHKTNGLMYGLDNWLYNAKSDVRYRKIDGEWVKDKTEYRGQWGITQDNYGRIYSNTNSNLITAEFIWPGAKVRNPNHDFAASTSAGMDNRVWPIRITCGINRGYQEDMLTEDGFLTKVTATCGPVVYRGDRFPEEYQGNLFIPEPVGMLVKRAIVTETEDGTFKINAAYQGKEFLASTDERSRMVNAFNAPDGTLYLVDFYRGIVQHKTYVTTYLRNQIVDRGLDKHIGLGRIYRIVHESARPGPQPHMLDETPAQWVAHLSHPNGWWRDTAQRLLVQKGDRSVAPALRELLAGDNELAAIHALWTLEGLGEANAEDLSAALSRGDEPVTVQAVRVAGVLLDQDREGAIAPAIVAALNDIDVTESPKVRRELAATLGRVPAPARAGAFSNLAKILEADDSRLTVDMAMSGLAGAELEFFQLAPRDKAVTTPLMAAIVRSGRADEIGELADEVLASNDSSLIKALSSAAVRGRSAALCSRLLEFAGKTGNEDLRKQVLAGLASGKSGKYKPIKLSGDLAAGFSDSQQKELAKLFVIGGDEEKSLIVTEADKALYKLGEEHYSKICIACHQPTGKGLQFVAPPIVDSEWVDGPDNRLIALVMDGVMGPITVNGKEYKAPEIQPVMPGLRVNPELGDKEIAAMLTYVRNTWGNRAAPIREEQVAAYRKANEARAPYTEDELKKVK